MGVTASQEGTPKGLVSYRPVKTDALPDSVQIHQIYRAKWHFIAPESNDLLYLDFEDEDSLVRELEKYDIAGTQDRTDYRTAMDQYPAARGFQGLEEPVVVYIYPQYLTAPPRYMSDWIERRAGGPLGRRAADSIWLAVIESSVPSDYYDVMTVEVTHESPDGTTTQTRPVYRHDAERSFIIETVISQPGRNSILGSIQLLLPTVGVVVTYLAIMGRASAFAIGIIGVLVAIIVLLFRAS
ncbi:hypothetical protein ABW21_db0205189 [Orbilia brochopaga]|nr:hypothetical protein ABW21_db0205189 [Drechslerella brochopaga]